MLWDDENKWKVYYESYSKGKELMVMILRINFNINIYNMVNEKNGLIIMAV